MTSWRVSVLVGSLALVASSACSYDPMVDANGFKCQSNGDCPSDFSCVKTVGQTAGVCCNRPDAAACLPPAKDAASDPLSVLPDLLASDPVPPDVVRVDAATPDGIVKSDVAGLGADAAPVADVSQVADVPEPIAPLDVGAHDVPPPVLDARPDTGPVPVDTRGQGDRPDSAPEVGPDVAPEVGPDAAPDVPVPAICTFDISTFDNCLFGS